MVNRKLQVDLESRTFRSFGALVKHLRIRSGDKRPAFMSQMKFNRSAEGYLRKVENEKVRASPRLLAAIVQQYDLDPKYAVALMMHDEMKPYYQELKRRGYKL